MSSAPPEMPVAILAGGLATRLGTIAARSPKLLLEVAGKPFFEHQLDLLRQHGLTRIVVCAGHLGEMITHRYGDGSDWGVQIEYSFDGSVLLGTGGALIKARPLLGSACYILYGDSYLQCDYRAIGQAFLASGKPGLMTVFANHGAYDTSNVCFAHNRILVYDKRYPSPSMHHIDYGLGILRTGVFDNWPNDTKVDLADIYQSLVSQEQMAGYEVAERFYEIGSPRGLNELDQYLSSGSSPQPDTPCPIPPNT